MIGAALTKEDLKQYRGIVMEIDKIQKRINENTIRDTVKASDREYPYVQHSISIGGINDIDTQKEAARKRGLEVRKQEIEDFINNIPDSLTKMIFQTMYIDGTLKPKWKEVTKILYPNIKKRDINRVTESIRKNHDNFLKKI